MSNANRARRAQNREARIAAEMEALHRLRRRRLVIAGSGFALALVVAVVLVARARSNDSSNASSPTTTTAAVTTTTLGSAAGKPCVKLADPLPKGAPNVPIKAGPPPKKLVEKDLVKGTGAIVKANATVRFNYIGVACSTGKIFDSSYATGAASYPLSELIPGWSQGIPGMRVGGERLLVVPPALGYKSAGQDDTIRPDETLWFVVQVLSTQ